MRHTITASCTVTLSLTVREAMQLKAWLQNPLNSSEGIDDKNRRINIFASLPSFKELEAAHALENMHAQELMTKILRNEDGKEDGKD